MQRFVRPAIFVVLLLAVLFMTLLTDRGENLTSPFMMGRLADFADGSPLLSTLFTIVLLPLALFICLFPEDAAITMTVGDFGFWLGILVATYAFTAVGGTTCALTRGLLQGIVRRFMAARRQAQKAFSRRAVMPLEYCLLLEVVLLVLGVPAVIVGFLLGLAGMRTKSFCVAAVPILLARSSVIGLGTVQAGVFTLISLGLLVTVLTVLYLLWVRMLFQKRMAKEREDSIRALVKPSEAFREPRPAFENIDLDEDADRPHKKPQRDNLSLGKTLMVLVRESGPAVSPMPAAEGAAGTAQPESGQAGDTLPTEDLVARLAEEGRNLGLRVLVCSMDESARKDADGQEKTILGGFADTEVVADLGELFWRGFQEGATTVLAVRAASPFASGEILGEAAEASKKSGLSLVPLMGEKKPSFCVVALTSPFGERRFDKDLLGRQHFRSDVAFALTGFAPHPEVLRPLPHVALCRPLVSVALVGETASKVLLDSIRRVQTSTCAECVAVLLPEARELESEAHALGARVVLVEDIRGVNEAVPSFKGSVVLFATAGVLLPERFDEAVWQCMEKERCVLGNFGLPPQVPGLQRALRWFGSSVKPGKGSGPALLQGVFLGRDDFLRFGGFESANIEEAVDALVQRAHMEGDVVPHNRRVTLAKVKDDEDGNEDCTAAKGLAKFGLTRLFERKKDADELASSGQEEMEKAREMVEECDHCGRCTHVSPMLHKHNVDLADLPKKPLLAWHCFLCGACTAVCHKGIDAVNLARTLRKAYVARHGNRVARPGHGKTVALQKMVGVFAKTALPGKNLLLDAEFCCAWPKTALALAKKARSWNVGVVIAEPGARAMDLGLEQGAKKKARALRSVMDKKGITGFFTVSPTTHAYLVASGIACEPVYTLLREMGQAHVDLTGVQLLDPVNDRAREIFTNALTPLLDGERRMIDIPCCGSGGEAAVVEPKLSADLKNAVKATLKPKERVLTTSTHCAESLSHAGIPCDHAITALMGLKEKAASGLGQISALVKTLVAVSSLTSDKDEKTVGDEKAEGRVAFVKGLFEKFMKLDGERKDDVPAAPLDSHMPDEGVSDEKSEGKSEDMSDGMSEDKDEDTHETELSLDLSEDEGEEARVEVKEEAKEEPLDDSTSSSPESRDTEPASATPEFEVTPSEEALAQGGDELSFHMDEEAEDRKDDLAATPVVEPVESRDEEHQVRLESNDAAATSDDAGNMKEKLEDISQVSLEEKPDGIPAQSHDKTPAPSFVTPDVTKAEKAPQAPGDHPETSAKPATRKPKIVFTTHVSCASKKPTVTEVKREPGADAAPVTTEATPEATEAMPRPVVSDVTEKGVIEIYEAEETQSEKAAETKPAEETAMDKDAPNDSAQTPADMAQDDKNAEASAEPAARPVPRMERAVSLKSFKSSSHASAPEKSDDADKGSNANNGNSGNNG